MMRKCPRPARAGFTLVEIMVAAGLSAFAVLAAFTFARFQISAFRTQTEVTHMNASAALIFQQLHRDLDNVGYGTSFWVGVQDGAFAAAPNVVTFPGYGIPSIRPSNNVASVGPNITDPMPATDIITLIRYESDSTYIPTSGPGETHVPAVLPNLGTGYLMADPTKLTCANRALDNDGVGDGLVILSNMSANKVSSFMLAVVPLSTVDTTPGVPGLLFFANNYLINPQSASARGPANVVPTGAGPGSQVICARPVAYWVDRGGRLRLWRSTTAFPAGTTAVASGAGGDAFDGRIDPQRDLVLAEGIEDLQIAYFTNSAALNANRWIYGDPDIAFGPNGVNFGNFNQLAEIRRVRVSAIVRTARRDQVTHPPNRPARLEDKVVAAIGVEGCTDPTACYDSRYLRRTVRFLSDLKNLRFIDLNTDPGLGTNEIRSYIP
jgi:type II secretory pathway pseudopilin PulG